MSDGHSVWTHTDDPAWLERNYVSDVLLVHGLTRENGIRLVERLRLAYGDRRAHVRDGHNRVVEGYAPGSTDVPRETTGPKRRALSKREG